MLYLDNFKFIHSNMDNMFANLKEVDYPNHHLMGSGSHF